MFSQYPPLIKIILLTSSCIAVVIVLSVYSLIPNYGLWSIGIIVFAVIFTYYQFWIKVHNTLSRHSRWQSLTKGMAQPRYAVIYDDHYDDEAKELVLQEETIIIKIKQIEQISSIINEVHHHQTSVEQDYSLTVILDIHPAIENSISTMVTQLQRQLRYCADIALKLPVPIVLRFFLPFDGDKKTAHQYSLLTSDLAKQDIQAAIKFFETAIEENCFTQFSQIQTAHLAEWFANIWEDIRIQHVRLCGFIVQPEYKPVTTNSLWHQYCLRNTQLILKSNNLPFQHQDFLASELFLAAGRISVSGSSRKILQKGIVSILSLAFTSACMFSAYHNYRLFQSIHRDIMQFKQANSIEQKQVSKSTLQNHLQTLHSYQMYGLPAYLGLGFFRAQVLLPELETALSEATPSEEPITNPTIINLDSLSLFDSGSAELKSNASIPLIKILQEIDKYPDMYIVIEGHTDNTGSAILNQTLSEQRALSVRNWLMDFYQLPASRFAVKGYGSSKPIASNDTEEGRAKNRRVSIILIPKSLLDTDTITN